MSGLRKNLLLILSLLLVLCTCIDPYSPNLSEYQSLLVVEGLITNANSSYSIRLSRTFSEQATGPALVNDAKVFITDNNAVKTDLKSAGNGIYKTDSTAFRGETGKTYVLHILTGGEEYESDKCSMFPVQPIDSIYFERDQHLVNNQTETEEGISVYLDSRGGDRDQFYRWTYEETWKFKVPFPRKYYYVKQSDPNSPVFMPVSDIKETCWKSRKSDEIMIKSMNEGFSPDIIKQPVEFIASAKSDRLLMQYSLLVKQYSISRAEYEFWNNLKLTNETSSDIFARQPYTLQGNIHNINNNAERVLGFFQVSAVSEKRRNIVYRDVTGMGLPFYSYTCNVVAYQPGDFETRCACPPKTWDDVYWYLSIASDYTFIEPKFVNVADVLALLVFTRPECADCSLTGSHVKPAYWDEFDKL